MMVAIRKGVRIENAIVARIVRSAARKVSDLCRMSSRQK